VHPQDFQKIPVIVNGDDPVSHQFSRGGWAAGYRIRLTKSSYAKMERKSSGFDNFLELQPLNNPDVAARISGAAARGSMPKWNCFYNILK
jgi:hypothetical protein